MTSYNQYDFLKEEGFEKLIGEHSMYKLSRGLLLIAATSGNAKDREVFTSNFDHEYARNADSECRPIFPKLNESTN